MTLREGILAAVFAFCLIGGWNLHERAIGKRELQIHLLDSTRVAAIHTADSLAQRASTLAEERDSLRRVMNRQTRELRGLTSSLAVRRGTLDSVLSHTDSVPVAVTTAVEHFVATSDSTLHACTDQLATMMNLIRTNETRCDVLGREVVAVTTRAESAESQLKLVLQGRPSIGRIWGERALIAGGFFLLGRVIGGPRI